MDEETKDVTKSEEAQEEKQDANEKDEDHSIYKLLKEDGTIIGAVGTALVTLLAFCLRMSSYLYHLAFLKYWDIDPNIVSEPENYWLENIAFSFLFTVSSMVYMNLLTNLLVEKALNKEPIRRVTKELKKREKKRRQHQREISHDRNDLEKNRREHSTAYYNESKSFLDQEEKQITMLQSEAVQLKQKIKESKKVHNKHYRLKLIGWSIPFTIVASMSYARTSSSLLQRLGAALLSVFVYWILALVSSKILIRKKIASLSDEDIWKEEGTNGLYSTLVKGSSELFTNDKIIVTVVMLICYGLIFLVLQNINGRTDAKQKRTFLIVNASDTAYAVITSDSDYMIAEEIMISDDSKSATIYSDSIFIISKESEPVLEKKSFEKAPIVKAKGADE